MDKTDLEIIDKLSAPARKLFFNLDQNAQKRILRKAKQLAKSQMTKEKQKSKTIKKNQMNQEEKKVKESKRKKQEVKERINYKKGFYDAVTNAASFSYKGISTYKETTAMALGILLTGQNASEHTYEEDGNRGSPSIVPAQLAKTSSRKVNSVAQSQIQKRRMKRNLKQTRNASEKSVKAGIKAMQETAKTISSAMSKAVIALAANPVTWIVLLVVLLLAIIGAVIGMVVGGTGAAENTNASSYQAQVSEKTEEYRDLVEKYCDKYDIDDYVDLCLAMIEQESGGNPPDVMQTEQSYYNTNPPIDSAEESIDCGTHELSDCLKAAKCKDASDINAIKLAIQGYNFGNGYIAWAIKNYGGYTHENAKIFSENMCAKLGYSGYGDVDYVPHVLRYYIENPDTKVTNESADKLLKELKENNKASDDIWKMIEKGASLIGTVEYSMEKRQGDGRDNPEYLDCSSFTAWAFHKSGITNVPYGSTTATFVTSDKFKTIEAKDLQPGDIGLKNMETATGGSNHVGIYCGQLKNGTKVWLHCTSNSGSSLTGNTSGPMFGAYTNFMYFRRLKKWNK